MMRFLVVHFGSSHASRQSTTGQRRPLPPLPTPGDYPGLEPDGVFARFGYPGARVWMEACAGPVVAHWPWWGEDPPSADVLVGSAADLDPPSLAEPLAAARAVAAGRLRWAVLTRGAGGATAYAPRGAFPPRSTVYNIFRAFQRQAGSDRTRNKPGLMNSFSRPTVRS